MSDTPSIESVEVPGMALGLEKEAIDAVRRRRLVPKLDEESDIVLLTTPRDQRGLLEK